MFTQGNKLSICVIVDVNIIAQDTESETASQYYCQELR